MDEKLSYLRAAFDALGGGKSVVEIPGKRTPSKPSKSRMRLPSYVRLLSMAGFERLTPAKKIHYLKYLSRAYADLQLQMTAYFRSSSATALPISSVPIGLSPGAARSAVRKPRAKTERTARWMRSSPSKSSKE